MVNRNQSRHMRIISIINGLIIIIILFFTLPIINVDFSIKKEVTEKIDFNPKVNQVTVSPNLLGKYGDNSNMSRDVYISGTIAYVADLYDGLEIINVADPYNPSLLGRYGDAYNESGGIYVSGDLVYVADRYDGLEIINVSDPTNPTFVGRYDEPYSSAREVYVSGNIAYVADGDDGLEIIDITDPASPNELGQFSDGGHSFDVFVSGNIAYLADTNHGLEIIDVSNTSNPELLGKYGDNNNNSYGLYVSNSIAYVADIQDGLEIIDVSNPSDPILISRYGNDFNQTRSVYVSDSIAYVADWGDGLEIVDVSDPANPVFLGKYSDDYNRTLGAYVYGDYAYLGDWNDGLEIIDLEMDWGAPLITINSPNINDNLFGETAPSFNIEVDEPNLDTIWYTIDGGITNKSFDTNSSIDQMLWEARGNGTVTLNFYANDTYAKIGAAEIVVRKDVLAPIITINSPATNVSFEFAPAYSLFIVEGNLDKIWYSVDNGATNHTISSLSGNIDEAIWSGLSQGPITIRFYANDTLGHIGWKEVNIIKISSTVAPPDIWTYIIIFSIIISAVIIVSLLIRRKKIEGRGIRVFISHAVNDYTNYRIADVAKYLASQKEISHVYYCEEDLVGDIDDWMLKTVPKCQLLIFFTTDNSINSEDCIKELRLALRHNIQITPILGEKVDWNDLKVRWEDLNLDLSRQFGKEFNSMEFDNFCKELYDYVLKYKKDLEKEILEKKQLKKR